LTHLEEAKMFQEQVVSMYPKFGYLIPMAILFFKNYKKFFPLLFTDSEGLNLFKNIVREEIKNGLQSVYFVCEAEYIDQNQEEEKKLAIISVFSVINAVPLISEYRIIKNDNGIFLEQVNNFKETDCCSLLPNEFFGGSDEIN